MNLLHIRTPPTEADAIREAACRALNGISRYEPVRQILSKLPLIAANGINSMYSKLIELKPKEIGK